MKLNRCNIVLAMILCATVNQAYSTLSSYDTMQCLFHASHEAEDSCLLGGKFTNCGFYRCFQTVGKSCSTGNEMKLNGKECAKSLMCGCDKKCNGCMKVNGETKCHYADCLPFQAKRNQMKVFPLAQFEANERSVEYPLDDSMLMAV